MQNEQKILCRLPEQFRQAVFYHAPDTGKSCRKDGQFRSAGKEYGKKHLRGLLQGGAAPCRADFPVTVPSGSEMHKSARKNSAQIEIVLHGYFQKSRYNTNNASLIARKIPVPQEKQINFLVAILVCKQFLKGKIRPAQIFEILSKYLSPIRPGRQYRRYQNPVSAVAFQYRFS